MRTELDPSRPVSAPLSVPFEKHVLANGLQVVLHEDHTSPVVAVHVCYHVGSAREEPGKSGFAHLFEHMLFQGSQHVADNDHFRLISEAGGALNGNTTTDRTLYFETLPSNQLELALWLESDRMGFLLPAMTRAKLDNQREVVLNERRQNYETRPYGRALMATCAALFPPDHPYSWLTIGSARDIRGATLRDVRSFFRRWYGPANATLALGGDLDPDAALEAVEHWFGALPPGPPVPELEARPASLAADARMHQEDRVQSPRLLMTWPTPERGHPDRPALRLLAMLLSQNKASVLDRALMVDAVLAREVFVLDWPGELAGRFTISVTAAPGVALGAIEARVRELLAELDRGGVDPLALARMQSRQEADFVRGLETVTSRVEELALSNTLLGDPAAFLDEQAAVAAVTADDVRRVLRTHLADRPCVVLSVVPEGRVELASGGGADSVAAPQDETEAGSIEATSGEAPPDQPADEGADGFVQQPAAQLDPGRSSRPPAGPAPALDPPRLWHDRDASGLELVGVDLPGSPLVTLRLALAGGRVLERPSQQGLSTLMAQLIEEGTETLSTTELTERLDALGAGLWVRAGDDVLTLTMTALDRHLEDAAALLAEVVRAPRLARADFERLRTLRLAEIGARQDQIRAVAHDVWQRLIHASGPLAAPALGRREAIAALTRDDAARHHARHCEPAPAGAWLVLVGELDAARARTAFEPLRGRWNAEPPRGSHAPGGPLERSGRTSASEPGIALVHSPGAAQSELRVGHLSVSSLDPDWYPLQVLNFVLGGNFNSRINLNLREDKGYTYGARSSFQGGPYPGPFTAEAAVHTDATAPALVELLGELERIREGVTPAELDFAREALTQALLRRYEGSAARLALASNVARYRWPDDYPARQLEELERLTPRDLTELARRHLDPARLQVLVVGDRDRVRGPLEGLGRSPLRELDSYGDLPGEAPGEHAGDPG